MFPVVWHVGMAGHSHAMCELPVARPRMCRPFLCVGHFSLLPVCGRLGWQAVVYDPDCVVSQALCSCGVIQGAWFMGTGVP